MRDSGSLVDTVVAGTVSFRQKVHAQVSKIPRGKVTTYGAVAAIVGSPRAARQVGMALRTLGIAETTIPWWRVINSQGKISINHNLGGGEKYLQAEMLGLDGIKVNANYRVDLSKYLWKGE